MLHGLMTEEINYSFDGGLYAELLPNGVFHSKDSWRTPIDHWSLIQRGNSQASFISDTTTGPSAALPYSLKLTIDRATASSRAGVANAGYWGIPVRPATTYSGSLYAPKAARTSLPHPHRARKRQHRRRSRAR